MNTVYQRQPTIVKWGGNCFTVLFVLSLLLAGCTPATPPTTSPPQAAPTAATVLAQPTPVPTQITLPTPTSTATTTLPPTKPPLPSPTSTPTTPPTQTPLPVIFLTDWRLGNFIEIPEGCLFEGTTCWQTVVSEERLKLNSKMGRHFLGSSKKQISQSSESSLTSRSSFLVDPAWNNPYLVYWYDNQINGDIYITAKVDQGAQAAIWETLANHSFTGQSQANKNWKIDTLDLSKYRGQKIFISLYADIILPPAQNGPLPNAINKWHVQKILILPDYKPGMENELSSVASARIAETSTAISPTNTLTDTGSAGPIQLADWKLVNLSQVSSGCKFSDLICWASIMNPAQDKGSVASSHSNTTVIENQSSLISQNSLYIDQAWINPQLVFWYDGPFPGDLLVSVKADLNWKMLAHFPISGQNTGTWQAATIDLNPLKGKNILLSIFVTMNIPKSILKTGAAVNRWHIQNIQLIPEFTGTP
jgi:hypothetical protein